MSNIWFTSDTHYNHKNIVRGCSAWEDNPNELQRKRDFDTLEEHNSTLVNNFNKLVKQDDILYHLGDWSFGGFESIRKFREQLVCQNIHLIFGNHDHPIENNRENIRDLFTSVQYYKELSLGGKKVILSHYAMRVWHKSHHGSFMLYGHSHGTLKGYEDTKTMDVGVDTNDLKPYSFTEINRILEKRGALLKVDHHSKQTN